MPFRTRIKVNLASPCPTWTREDVTLPTGDIETTFVDDCEKSMPEPELFDLKNQIDAGIEPEEVNSTVLKSSNVNANTLIRKYTKKSTNDEVNE